MSLHVLGVDVGYGYVKTANTVFGSGVVHLPGKPPLSNMVIESVGNFYSVGNSKISVQRLKTDDEKMLILTMAAIAEELKKIGVTKGDIRLGVGTPLTSFGAEKDGLLQYYSKNRNLIYKYEDTPYSINIISIDVFPQGYSGVASKLGELKKSSLVIDVGTRTVDLMPIVEGVPDLARCKSLQTGIITSIHDIQEALRQRVGQEADSLTLKEVMVGGFGDIPEEYLSVIREGCSVYVNELMDQIRALNFNLDLTEVIFIGGGASVVKNFISEDYKNVVIYDDIHMNARGYETLIHRKYKD